MVADDDVWLEAEALQVARGLGDHLGAQHGELELLCGRMGAGRHAPRQLVEDAAHAGQHVAVRLADEHHLVLALPREVADQVQELAREVLVDEQISQETA